MGEKGLKIVKTTQVTQLIIYPYNNAILKLVNYIETNLRHIKLSWSGANIIQLLSYLMYKRKEHLL